MPSLAEAAPVFLGRRTVSLLFAFEVDAQGQLPVLEQHWRFEESLLDMLKRGMPYVAIL